MDLNLRLKMKSLILGFSVLMSLFSVLAQPVFVAKGDDMKIYMSNPKEAPKVGNAVLIKVYEQMEYVMVEQSLLIDCRARWVSLEFGVNYYGQSDYERVMKARLTGNSSSEFNYGIELMDMNDSSNENLEIIKKNLPRYCATARERKGFFIPITHSGANEKGEYELYNLISSGSANYKTHNEVWLQIEGRVLKDRLDAEGNKRLDQNGNPIKYSAPDLKEYKVNKLAFNCKKSKIGSLTSITYSKDGNILRQTQNKYSENIMTETIPNTIGETLIERLCKIYN